MTHAATRSRYARLLQLIADFTTHERIRNYALMMTGITLGGGVLQMFLGDGLLDYFGNVLGGDFLAFYTGGRFYLMDRMADIYDFGAQLVFQEELIGVKGLAGFHPFVSPPNALALYLGFAIWSYPVAVALWWLVGLCSLALAVHLVRSELPELRRYATHRLFGVCFLFFPTVAWILYGQATALILLIYSGTFVLLRRKREFSAGFCLGCLAFKPQLALVLGIILILKWRWKALMGGVVSVACWLGIGFMISAETMLRYVGVSQNFTGFLRDADYPTWGVHSLFAFSVLLLDGLSLSAADVLTGLLSVGLLLWLGLHWRATPWEAGTQRWDLAMAAAMALGLVLSPHLFVYDLMLLLLPFAIVWNCSGRLHGGRVLDGGPVLAWTTLLWMMSFLGSYLTKGQLALCETLGLPLVALQLTTLVIVMWVISFLGTADSAGAADTKTQV